MSILALNDDEKILLARIHLKLEQARKHRFIDTLFTSTEPSLDRNSRENYKHWIQFFAASRKYKEKLALCANQVGKALHIDELVYTADGQKRIGDIQLGDKIFGEDGNLTNVIGVYPQGKRQLYKISFEDKTSILADIDHIWAVFLSSARSNGLQNNVRYNFTTSEIIDYMSTGIKFSIPLCDEVQFDKSYVPFNRYLIGILLGDGSFRQKSNIQFSTSDQEIVDAFRTEYNIKKLKGIYDYSISCNERSIELREYLKSSGLWGKKSEDKFIPQNLLFDSVDNRLSLLQGLIDSDGYVDKTGKVSFSSSSKQLANDTAFLARSLGYRVKVVKSKPKTFTYKGIKKTGLPSYEVRFSGRNKQSLSRLVRKQSLINDKNLSSRKVITSIELAHIDEAICIKVDNELETFLTSDFTVTHNTTAGLYELTLHATGEYPDWWPGYRFPEGNDWWVCGVDQESVVDVLQDRLLGPVGEFGTGFLPHDAIDFTSLRDAKKAGTGVGEIRVKHKGGGFSTLTFKSYQQGRESFQGKPGISVFMDEEPPASIYSEAVTRTIAGPGLIILTFTPLKGISTVVKNFLGGSDLNKETGELSSSRYLLRATWDDAPHLTAESKAAMLEKYLPHEREARSKGIPSIGSGAIFPFAQETITCEPFEIPKYWPKAYGFDVGRNTAAVWITQDRDSGMIYVYNDFFMIEGAPSNHAEGIKGRGKWIKGAIDTAARGRSPTDGDNLFQMYKDLGLDIQNADKAVEAGLYEIFELFQAGRLKIFNTCKGLLEELSLYRRDEKGKIVKVDDHRMDAFRYAIFTRDKILKTQAEVDQANKPIELDEPITIYHQDSWMLG